MEDTGTGIIPIFIAACIALPMLALFIWSVVWAYTDAERRGKSGCLAALLVFLLSWPVGLIVWLLIRPEDTYPPTKRV